MHALLWHGLIRGLAVFIARPAAARATVHACLRSVPPADLRALDAGVTWTNRTLTAPWDIRGFHTSVIDAAGAIYVLGGWYGSTYFNDVWASTDGGARPDSRRGWSGGTGWVLRGTREYY